MLVGRAGKPRTEGIDPYIHAIAIHGVDGVRTVYVLGYGEGVQYIGDIAHVAREQGIATDFSIEDFKALDHNQLREAPYRIGRLALDAEGAAEYIAKRHPRQTRDG